MNAYRGNTPSERRILAALYRATVWDQIYGTYKLLHDWTWLSVGGLETTCQRLAKRGWIIKHRLSGAQIKGQSLLLGDAKPRTTHFTLAPQVQEAFDAVADPSDYTLTTAWGANS